MSYGPNPWQQSNWDARAAGNFICGGLGCGLIVFAALSPVRGTASALLLLAGLAVVGTGLLCVWWEIGRPLRALHVFFNPHTSWMTREAGVGVLLFGLGVAAAAGASALAPVVAVVALVFVYCQARMLQAAKGIPTWREPLLVPLIVATGLAEGAGLFWIAALWLPGRSMMLIALFAALLLVRIVLWRGWRHRIGASASARALTLLDRSGRILFWFGAVLPIALAALAATSAAGEVAAPLILALAGLTTALTGAQFKFVLITHAAFNQGFALARLPVRGVPR